MRLCSVQACGAEGASDWAGYDRQAARYCTHPYRLAHAGRGLLKRYQANCVNSSYYCLLGMQKFGYSTPNVRFVEGIIEDLGAAGIQVSFCSIVTKTWCPCQSQ